MVLPHPLHFLNPVALLGLLAALVPVAIHLLHRGRSRPVPFSNLALLRSLHQSRMRRLQLRQWLILLLRALAISLVALAFARPALHGSGGGPFGRPAPVRAAVLLDRSFSTGYRQPGGRVFDALRQQTQALVGLFGEGDDVAVIPFAADVRAGGLERRRLVEELAGLGTSAEGTDVAAALEAAERHLSAAPAGWRRELFLLGDRARAGWPAADSGPPRTWAAGAAVYVADPGPAPRANWFLASVVAETWLQAPGHRLDVVAQIASSAPGPANLGVDLFVDGQRLQRREVPLGPGQRAPVELSFAPRHAGPLAGYVEIDGDDLPLDDRRYFTLYVPATARVLVLGRDPRDTYFARTALAAAAGADAVLAVRSGLLSELSAGPLAGVDALILCNLSHLDREAARQVHDFVARGGTAVLFPGPDIDLSYYNRQLLPGLVPLVYKDQWGEPGSAPAARLDLDRIPHPLTAGLAGEPTPGFAALFEMVATQPITPLLATADGRLVAAEAPLGAGRVVLFAVPLSAAWSDLPLSGLFAPLLHRLARRAVLPEDHGRGYLVGEVAFRYLPGTTDGDVVQAETPSGRRLYLEPQYRQGRLYWMVQGLDEPGIWRLEREGADVDQFAVNVDARESDLTQVGTEQIDDLFGTGRARALRAGEDLRDAVLERRYGRELWRECLLAAVALLLLELWLARAPESRPVPA